MSASAVYKSRNPVNSIYYQCVEDYFEIFEQIYEERFDKQYGFYRPYVMQVIVRYLVAGFCITVLPGCVAMIAAMNTCWHFPVSDVIFVLHAIRSGWWSSASGYAAR